MHRILILFGSQTGTAQDLAESVWRQVRKSKCTGPVLPMDSYPIHNLINEKIVIFICSTTGQGDQPDNMVKFWKFLLRKSLPLDSLAGMQFAVLGLGDSSYSKFNFVAKKLHKRLIQLSAQPLLPLGLCDDQHDYGVYGEYFPWIESLWKTLNLQPQQSSEYSFKMEIKILPGSEVAKFELDRLKWPYSEDFHIFTVLDNKRVTAGDHFQETHHIRLAIPKNCTWMPFDVVNVQPANSNETVEKLFEIFKSQQLNFNQETLVEFSKVDAEMPLSRCYSDQILPLGIVAKYIWDLTAIPRQRVFELLAINCCDEMEKEKLLEFCSPQGCEDVIKYANRPRRTIIEVLHDFPNATGRLSLPILFELFDCIKLRSFSIASVPETGSLDLLVAIVEYKTILSEPRRGLCSNWLKRLQPNERIFGSLRKGTMHLPQSKTHPPLIMIGPGTGIAPFRSYLLKKESDLINDNLIDLPKILVFFGCRSKTKDFYFQDDFKRLERKNLAKFFYAFSRDQETKRYVQHVLREQEDLIRDFVLLKQGTVLLAGNSNNMPQQVKEAFVEIFGNARYLDEIMIKNNRYQEEVWS